MILKPKKLILALILVFSVCVQDLMAQSSGANTTQEVLSKTIEDEILWRKAEISLDKVSKIYLLDHGVVLDVPEYFTVKGIPVQIIQKNQLQSAGNYPLIKVHTLNIEDDRVLVRMYLSQIIGGIEKNSNAEFHFTKQNTSWVLTNKL